MVQVRSCRTPPRIPRGCFFWGIGLPLSGTPIFLPVLMCCGKLWGWRGGVGLVYPCLMLCSWFGLRRWGKSCQSIHWRGHWACVLSLSYYVLLCVCRGEDVVRAYKGLRGCTFLCQCPLYRSKCVFLCVLMHIILG